MISLAKALSSDRLMRAVSGLTPSQFRSLAGAFKTNLAHFYRTERDIISTRGRKGILKTHEEKMFYILFYYKVYPTFDLASLLFNADRSICCRWAHWYSKALELTLGEKLLLPARRASDLKELLSSMPELKEIFIDGTDRPVRRPKNSERQKNHYSGKKKRHSVKNIVITTKKKRIVLLTDTIPGSVHDYTAFKDSSAGDSLPEDIPIYTDTGFLGIQKDFPHLKIIMPKKKPKGGELSKSDKHKNQCISRKRIKVENALCGVKRFGIVNAPFRNHKENFVDLAMLLACSLWNFYLTS